MTKHFLFGYFGQYNSGDDAMLYCWLENMPESDKAYILAKRRCYIPECNHEFVYYSIIKIAIAILKCDRFVLVGGTHFSDYGLLHRCAWIGLRITILCLYARLLGKKVIFDRIGIVCRTGWMKLILKTCFLFVNEVSVRDSISWQILKSIGIKAEPYDDIARGMRKYITETSCGYLGVNVSPLNEIYYKSEYYNQANLKITARKVINKFKSGCYYGVKIIILNAADTKYSLMLKQMLPNNINIEVVKYNPNPVNLINEIAECKYLIAEKYHACYFAKLCGVPFENISDHPKNKCLI